MLKLMLLEVLTVTALKQLCRKQVAVKAVAWAVYAPAEADAKVRTDRTLPRVIQEIHRCLSLRVVLLKSRPQNQTSAGPVFDHIKQWRFFSPDLSSGFFYSSCHFG